MQDYVGKQIDRYRITERLGMGGMAVVYKAYDMRLERDVALKLIRTTEIPASQHARLMKRFEREARAQARFMHPHIVPAHDYGEFEGTPFIVLAYLPGGTLKDRMCGVMPVPEALELVMAIADAVAYAHSMGVLHRDIKPSNILFSKENTPMLSDFGIAKMLETTDVTLTGIGLGVGTPEYMAPEQWQGKAIEASDQYALGVVLYELLTGDKPYAADTPLAVALKVMNDPLKRPRDSNPAIPEGVEKLLYKSLAREPKYRYVDLRAFGLALKKQLNLSLPMPEQDAKESRPVPATQTAYPATALESEAETIDELVATSVEAEAHHFDHHIGNSPKTKLSTKFRLPVWAIRIGGIATLILLMVAGISMVGGGRNQEPKPTTSFTETVVSLVDTPLPTTTNNPVPTLTETSFLSPSATEFHEPTSTQTATPIWGIGSTMVNPIDGVVMVYVPEGEFLMGSQDEDAEDDEKPLRAVYLDAFWIYQYPVTNAKYRMCIESGWCSGELFQFPNDTFPATQVTWYEARAYCQWAGGRLPTEAEWEKTARGTDGRIYPWGDQTPTCGLANYGGCVGGPSPVGSYTLGVSPFGGFDMTGNVWEWVADWFDPNYYRIAPYKNPTGPHTAYTSDPPIRQRVLRGGSWDYFIRRVSQRYGRQPDISSEYFGFRCVYAGQP